ncbi:MAG: 4-hydroxythreonine-4-phosphate dehydrogenase PdxA [Syntrophus sp. (in: bacteria)]|nr:4-hydroxythreonine-4-phosphate dehydrogenase PdxA [Syntrophus sp. (in: bacteria)]
MGDPAGIGGELILKSLPRICRKTIPVIIGDHAVMEVQLYRLSGAAKPSPFKSFKEGQLGDAEFVDLGLIREDVEYGITRAQYGDASFRYITEALKYIFSGEVSALVTCPINKAAFSLAGVPFTGHTELLAHYGNVTDYVMMMANRVMRVSLATIHIPLKEVPVALSVEGVLKTITITHRALQTYFAIEKPRIKVSGLNPHAGEQGIMGSEERLIEEAISRARSIRIDAVGPFPADTLFHRRDCDAFIAMYHDQGLIPVKTLDFKHTVNITLGLPFIRTSPGHGTGFDIAGQWIADPSGFIEAYMVAEKMAASIK